MNMIISGKQMELTPGIKGAIEEKLGRVEHYLHPDTEVKVTVRAKKARQTIEVTIIPISGPIIRAEDSEENLYAAIDVVYDKLNRQLRRYKNKLIDRTQTSKSIKYEGIEINEDLANIDSDIDDDEKEEDIIIERRKKFGIKPMSPEEAVLQMELLEHDFYMFKNSETDEMSVVYKRKMGGYGLLEQQ